MPTLGKPSEDDEPTEDMQESGARFKIDGPDGEKVLIGGLTADTVDLLDSIEKHLPWMAGIIVAVMLVLLFLAFGSVTLPIKAVVVNLLSISASFGVIAWIFQGGRLEGFLDYSSTGFLDAVDVGDVPGSVGPEVTSAFRLEDDEPLPRFGRALLLVLLPQLGDDIVGLLLRHGDATPRRRPAVGRG